MRRGHSFMLLEEGRLRGGVTEISLGNPVRRHSVQPSSPHRKSEIHFWTPIFSSFSLCVPV